MSVIRDLDRGYFAMGSLAPDCGQLNEDTGKYEPPLSTTHYMPLDASSYTRIQDLLFLRKYENLLLPGCPDRLQRSFLVGYFFHLIADKLWILDVVHPGREQLPSELRGDAEVALEVKRDWYGQDFIYVREHANSLFWTDFLPTEYQHDYLADLPPTMISKKLAFIRYTYQRDDEEIQPVFEREYKFFSGEDMNQALVRIVDQCAFIYRQIWLEKVDIQDLESAIQLLET